MSRRSILIWGLPALLYAGFFIWYTDLGGPLTQTEISNYLELFEERGVPSETLNHFRGFMEGDTGRQFLMLNIIDFSEDPPDVPGAEPGEDAQQLMSRYMEHMYAELFKRACHPVTVGNAIHRALDLVGVDALDSPADWDAAAFMRYRSRRALMEVVTNPETGTRHEFKVAAINKTIAFPIETQFNLGDPRVTLGLALFSVALLLDRVGRRSV